MNKIKPSPPVAISEEKIISREAESCITLKKGERFKGGNQRSDDKKEDKNE